MLIAQYWLDERFSQLNILVAFGFRFVLLILKSLLFMGQ